MQLALAVHLILGEQIDRILPRDHRQRIHRVLQIRQPALLGLLVPFFRIIVTVEDDPLALLDDPREQILNRLVQILPTPGGVLKLRGNRIQ